MICFLLTIGLFCFRIVFLAEQLVTELRRRLEQLGANLNISKITRALHDRGPYTEVMGTIGEGGA